MSATDSLSRSSIYSDDLSAFADDEAYEESVRQNAKPLLEGIGCNVVHGDQRTFDYDIYGEFQADFLAHVNVIGTEGASSFFPTELK